MRLSTVVSGTVAVTLALAMPARADDDEPHGEKGRPSEKGTLGVGSIVGEPTGICAKIYLSQDRALQLAAGSAFISTGLQLHADYVFHPWILQDRDSFVLPVYVGPGARVIAYRGGYNGSSHFADGLRGKIGQMFDFTSVPLAAFIEV